MAPKPKKDSKVLEFTSKIKSTRFSPDERVLTLEIEKSDKKPDKYLLAQFEGKVGNFLICIAIPTERKGTKVEKTKNIEFSTRIKEVAHKLKNQVITLKLDITAEAAYDLQKLQKSWKEKDIEIRMTQEQLKLL